MYYIVALNKNYFQALIHVRCTKHCIMQKRRVLLLPFTLDLSLFMLVLFPCEFKNSLAVRQKQTLLTSTCEGSAVALHGVFAVIFYFYSVMTQAGAHSAQQAPWIAVFTKSTAREIADCVVVCREQKNEHERKPVFSEPSGVLESFLRGFHL